MTLPPTLDVIIVNWNAGELLRRCLNALASAQHGSFALGRVVIVDNHSTDGSLGAVDGLPLPLTVIRNPTNRGFAAACNQGAHGSTASYLLFLNPDLYVAPDCLSRPIAFLESAAHSDVGVVGIQLRDGTGAIARSCTREPTPAVFAARMLGLDVLVPGLVPSLMLTDWPHDTTREVPHVIGAFYLIRRPLFDALGGFDERFFVYLEDVDLSVRARARGAHIVFLADVHAEHTGGGTSEAIRATRIAYSLESRIRYGYKHFSPPTATALAVGTLVVEPWVRIAGALARARLEDAVATVVGFWRLWRRTWTRRPEASPTGRPSLGRPR